MRCIAQIKDRVALEEVLREAPTASRPSWVFAGLEVST